MDNITQIWSDWRDRQDYLSGQGLYTRVEECHEYVNGDQWRGLKSGSERLARLNYLKSLMKTATALVGQNTMTINYSPMIYGSERQKYLELCEKLNRQAASTLERIKWDKYSWEVLENAYISGDCFVYFYDDDTVENKGVIKMELIDTTKIAFADENNPNIQEQPFILVPRRLYIKDVIDTARKNGKSEEDIGLIVADERDPQLDRVMEVDDKLKINTVTEIRKKDGKIYLKSSTKSVEFEPEKELALSIYPIAKYSWNLQRGKARGIGEIWYEIPNQQTVNKCLYRFETAIKNSAFPHPIYMTEAISKEEVEKLSLPGSGIGISGGFGANGIKGVIDYLQPATISPYAQSIWQDIMSQSKVLKGAGDNLENVNPEQASGAAINAAREAKMFSVNLQVAAYKQFIEDVALILYDMYVTYNPNGLEIVSEDQSGEEMSEIIPVSELERMKVEVRIDVSPNTPYSKLGQELSLKELFQAQAITFEELVEALDEDSNMPKARLQDIVEKRKTAEQDALMMKMQELAQFAEGLKAQNQELTAQLQQGEAASQKLVGLTNYMQNKEKEEAVDKELLKKISQMTKGKSVDDELSEVGL